MTCAHMALDLCDQIDAVCCCSRHEEKDGSGDQSSPVPRIPICVRFFSNDFRFLPLSLRVVLFALFVAVLPFLALKTLSIARQPKRTFNAPWTAVVGAATTKSKRLLVSPYELDGCAMLANDSHLNRSLLRANEESLLTYLFIAGVEGAGHHGILSLFGAAVLGGHGDQNLTKESSEKEVSDVHEAAHTLWKAEDAKDFPAKRVALADALSKVAARVKLGKSARVLVGPVSGKVSGENGERQPLSYPFGSERTAVHRPHMADIFRACLEAGVRFRVVVLYRDPIAATLSRWHQMHALRDRLLVQVLPSPH